MTNEAIIAYLTSLEHKILFSFSIEQSREIALSGVQTLLAAMKTTVPKENPCIIK